MRRHLGSARKTVKSRIFRVKGANELINAGGVYLILGVQVGCLIDRRPFKKKEGLYFHNFMKLNKTNMLVAKISKEF